MATKSVADLEARVAELEAKLSLIEAFLAPFVDMLDAYFRGEGIASGASGLCLEGIRPFPRRVYETLLAVPFGQMVGYGELATLCGRAGIESRSGYCREHSHDIRYDGLLICAHRIPGRCAVTSRDPPTRTVALP